MLKNINLLNRRMKEEFYLGCNGGYTRFEDGALASIQTADRKWQSCLLKTNEILYHKGAHVRVNLIKVLEDNALIEINLKGLSEKDYQKKKLLVPKEDLKSMKTPETLYEKLNVIGQLKKARIISLNSLSLEVWNAPDSYDLLTEHFRSESLEVAVKNDKNADVGIDTNFRTENDSSSIAIKGYSQKGKDAVKKFIDYLSENKKAEETIKTFIFQ
jgi:hypothetical protein